MEVPVLRSVRNTLPVNAKKHKLDSLGLHDALASTAKEKTISSPLFRGEKQMTILTNHSE